MGDFLGGRFWPRCLFTFPFLMRRYMMGDPKTENGPLVILCWGCSPSSNLRVPCPSPSLSAPWSIFRAQSTGHTVSSAGLNVAWRRQAFGDRMWCYVALPRGYAQRVWPLNLSKFQVWCPLWSRGEGTKVWKGSVERDSGQKPDTQLRK